uniref:Uncharacterized protein n=1 Tax=Trypanosoma vivax (strain Y486) TaxID=1055687 RepID=G0U9W9_TRYVY|nr:hypothetical protein TVY486_1100850 [Trypanosoma vivax Y486]
MGLLKHEGNSHSPHGTAWDGSPNCTALHLCVQHNGIFTPSSASLVHCSLSLSLSLSLLKHFLSLLRFINFETPFPLCMIIVCSQRTLTVDQSGSFQWRPIVGLRQPTVVGTVNNSKSTRVSGTSGLRC